LPTEEQLTPNGNLSPEIVAETVSCLYDFFLAGRGRDLALFSDIASVQRRIISTCAIAIPDTRPAVLVWDSFEFSIDLLSSSESAWEEYTTNTNVARIYEGLLLAHHDLWVRRHTAMLIQRKLMQWPVSQKISHSTFVMFLWKMVSEMIPRAVSTPQRAAEIFEIALATFKSLLTQSLISETEATDLFRSWAPLLVAHHHHEFVGRDEPDAILRGLAGLLLCTAETYPDVITAADKISFIEKIFRKFLFQREPKTKAELALVERELPTLETNTRMDLVALIATLATNNEIVDLLCNLLSEIDIRYLDKQVDKTGLLRSPAGYVGLKNLGQTCYMNSLMTQLFMNPVFRAFILSCAPLTKASIAPLLHETQRLFAIMQNSFHGYASAADFTRNIVTLTEEKIDPREQMDVDEFMNTLFHRWEEQMPSNDFKQRLRSVYTGKTVQQIKSKECEHVSEREDTCLAIPCDVQGNTTLEESLKAYVQGDVMEGGQSI
jgi:ubiquitin carboxyl-terminal hydrolase 34